MKLSRMTRWIWIAGLAVTASIAVGASNLRSSATSASANSVTATSATPTSAAAPSGGKSSGGPVALTVSVVQPERADWPELIHASGTIAPWQEAIVGAEVTGLRLSQLLVDVGDEVKKGQLLAQFDDATTLAMVRQSEAAVAEAEANVAEAEANAQRAERLGKTGALSQQDATQYLTRARTAQAQLESARARLHSQKLALEYTRVVAPDDGVVSARKATLGMVAQPGTELFRLVRQNRLDWRAELSGAQLAQVHVGDVASVTLGDGSLVTGKVRQVAPVLDENTRIGLAYVELDRAGDSANDATKAQAARAGMYGTGTITLGSRTALTLPSSALVLRDGHEYVFVLGPDNRVALTKISVGRRVGNGVEVSDGLSGDERIVSAGAAFLNDADFVRVVDSGSGKAS
ncbi:MAG TPA: efflux RND transporter periplasmic adaptor subunit [Pseudomonadales bacterium]|nr:efflux RND transporter periplasmic adaptor subunit [Pseudomonadales bacterium]